METKGMHWAIDSPAGNQQTTVYIKEGIFSSLLPDALDNKWGQAQGLLALQ